MYGQTLKIGFQTPDWSVSCCDEKQIVEEYVQKCPDQIEKTLRNQAEVMKRLRVARQKRRKEPAVPWHYDYGGGSRQICTRHKT